MCWQTTYNHGLTRARSCHGPALARRPSRLVNTLEWAASRRLQIASRGSATPWRQPPCRVGFGTWALAVQLRLKPLGRYSIQEGCELNVFGDSEHSNLNPHRRLLDAPAFRVPKTSRNRSTSS
jgi:hypothetical protein